MSSSETSPSLPPRRCLLLSGDAAWCRIRAAQLTDGGEPLWVSDSAPAGSEAITADRAPQLLGSERVQVVFDSHAGFDPDAFAAVAGLIPAGGCLLLLTPPLAEWSRFADPQYRRLLPHGSPAEAVTGRFLRHLATRLGDAATVELLTPDADAPAPLVVPRRQTATGIVATPSQRAAIDALVRVATGHRNRPLVLTADRGRGKSAALGMAAAEVLEAGRERVLVTAPRLAAAQFLFQHATTRLEGAESHPGVIRWQGHTIEFIPPDELLRHPQTCDLLLVDEAAAIPAPLLEGLLRRHARIAFATTVHGYEGTGRGFDLRFRKVLDRLTPQWKGLRLTRPIRWAEGDPLERLVFDALLLDAEPARVEADIPSAPLGIQVEDRNRLVDSPERLRQLFGLLVSAHYRTTPFDLRYLLDAPNVAVWTAEAGGKVVAAALVAEEGGIEPELLEPIWLGRRRPQGHLLPQTLSAHAGLRAAPALRYHRVVRIAVHPELQGRGIGSAMLARLAAAAVEAGMDGIGSSFGLTGDLLGFWERGGFLPVRLGLSRDASSGCHSVVMLRSLSAGGERLAADARQRFLEDFPELLAEPLAELEPELAAALLRGAAVVPTTRDADDLHAFARGNRDYADCLPALRRFAINRLGAGEAVDGALIVTRILQRRPWAECARLLGLPGRKQLIALLRELVRTGLPPSPRDGAPTTDS